MRPIGAFYFYKSGNDESRIGPNKRNPKLQYKDLELMLDKVSDELSLPITVDVKQIHPPYFTEVGYQDTLGGITINTLSAEITCRMTEFASGIDTDSQFPVDEVLDKYELRSGQSNYKKVVFLCGSNAMEFLDQSKLLKLMTEDEEWVIKLHPVTNQETYRDIASVFGYHRIVPGNWSGMDILKQASMIATVSTSETLVLGRLLGIPVIDLTKYTNAWLTCYYRYSRLMTGDNAQDKRLFTNALMSDYSGYLRPSYGLERNEELARLYFKKALELRQQFKQIVSQKLNVATFEKPNWNPK